MPTLQSRRVRPHVWLHLVVFIFGFTAILGKLISISAVPLVWVRMILAVAGLFAYALAARVSLRVPPQAAGQMFFVGLIVAVHWIAFFASIKASNVSIALVCLSSGSLFTALLEPLIFGRRFRFYELFFGTLAVLGLYFIFSFEARYTAGIALGILSAFLGALFTVINGRLIRRHDSTLISFYELLGGALGITIFLAFIPESAQTLRAISASDIVYLLILAWVCTAFAFVVNVKVMEDLSPFTVVLTTNLEPIYGIALALLIFGESERMTPQFYVGTAVILLTILADAVFKARSARGPEGGDSTM